MNFGGSRLGFWFRPPSRITKTKVLVFYDPTTYVYSGGGVYNDFYNPEYGTPDPATAIYPNIQSREIAAGYEPELIVGYDNLPADMSIYSHVWDIGYVSPYSINPLTDPTSKLTTFLQGGGSMFMLGENSGLNQPGPSPELTRWSTIKEFLNVLGANTGQPTVLSMDPTYYGIITSTVKPEFLIANNNNIVTLYAPGGWLNINQGTTMTTPLTGGNAYPSVMWETGSLPNATTGAIISVLDVDFLTTDFLQVDFIDNIIASLMQR
jgi:hypothetical protein